MIHSEILDGAICHISMRRPEKRNALGVDHYNALAEALDNTGDSAAVILSSVGEVFCAGNDLMEFATAWPQPENGPVVRFLTALRDVPVPVIAAVQGPAVGIGATMLLHCDVVLAAPQASLRYPFISLGLAPEGGSSLQLLERLGRQRAMDLLLTNRVVASTEALALGIVTSVVPGDELMPRAFELARGIAGQSRAAVLATKALVTGSCRDAEVAWFEREITVINGLIEQTRRTSQATG